MPNKWPVFASFLFVLFLMAWVTLHIADKGYVVLPATSALHQLQDVGSQLGHEADKELRERAERLQAQELHLKQIETQLILKYPQHADLMFGNEESVACIYAITPTYARPEQKAELTRLSHTFLHVRNFHWIVVEDSGNKTKLVTELLKRSGLKYTQLNVQTPGNYKKTRGVPQRNKALDWIRNSVDPKQAGVVYFADDDNTYDLRLFEEMRSTEKVSIWPVGLVGGLMYEGPICKDNHVIGFNAEFAPERRFPIDMAGFAINVKMFFDRPYVKFLPSMSGYLESDLLSGLLTSRQELEPRADGCSKVLVWHTQTYSPEFLEKEAVSATRGSEAAAAAVIEV